jgi:protein-tyrosine phosphatase
MSEQARHVTFEACFNFRDLGGYETADGGRLRWGVLYRSDTLHRLTANDAGTFRALGLRTVLDLRSSTEIEDYGRLSVIDDGLAWHNIPMLDNVKLAPPDPSNPPPTPPEPLAPGEGYFMIAKQFGPSIAQVFTQLSGEQALPAVFHCTAGKDRTGIIAALLLDLLGVPDEVIGADYVLTDASRERSGPWIKANEPQYAALLAQIPADRRASRAENILGFLERVRDTHDSAQGFLAELGVSEDRLEELRGRLLVD